MSESVSVEEGCTSESKLKPRNSLCVDSKSRSSLGSRSSEVY